MIHIEFENIREIEVAHVSAVKKYMEARPAETQSVYNAIRLLPEYSRLLAKQEDWGWLENFLLTDVDTMSAWVENYPGLLRFGFFKQLYTSRFSNGAQNYVDNESQYNAFKLCSMMDWHVCPYCDDELFNLVEVEGTTRRTMDFDHFFPKGDNEYPALAMCLYNLVPSGKVCNSLKLQRNVGASPYSPDIENLTHFTLDYALGANLETLSPENCELHLNVRGGMIRNNEVMALEQRYRNNHQSEAYDLCKKKQQFPDDKLEELERSGYGTKEEMKHDLFGIPYNEGKGKIRLQKMKRDLIGE
jgi:hypothetical protein